MSSCVSVHASLGYNLTWREGDGSWQEAWPVVQETRLAGVQQHTISGLKCGTKYSVRVTATDNVGTSAPAHVDVTTLGGGEWLKYDLIIYFIFVVFEWCVLLF